MANNFKSTFTTLFAKTLKSNLMGLMRVLDRLNGSWSRAFRDKSAWCIGGLSIQALGFHEIPQWGFYSQQG